MPVVIGDFEIVSEPPMPPGSPAPTVAPEPAPAPAPLPPPRVAQALRLHLERLARVAAC